MLIRATRCRGYPGPCTQSVAYSPVNHPITQGDEVMRTREAVWITGVGTANPLGTTFETSAENFLAGRSGVRAVTHLDVASHPSRIAGLVDAVPVPPGWDDSFTSLGRAEQL